MDKKSPYKEEQENREIVQTAQKNNETPMLTSVRLLRSAHFITL